MARKKKARADTTKIGLAVNRELWKRFERMADESVPRVSMTALLEAAIAEYLNRHKSEHAKRDD